MSFSTELKTIMKLDDSDWKKSLKSIKEVEKELFKNSLKNTEELIELKKKLEKADEKRSEQLDAINAKIKAEKKAFKKLDEDAQATEEKAHKKKITSLKKQKTEVRLLQNIEVEEVKRKINSLNTVLGLEESSAKYAKIHKQNILDIKKASEQSTAAINKETAATEALLEKRKEAQVHAKSFSRMGAFKGAGVLEKSPELTALAEDYKAQIREISEAEKKGQEALLSEKYNGYQKAKALRSKDSENAKSELRKRLVIYKKEKSELEELRIESNQKILRGQQELLKDEAKIRNKSKKESNEDFLLKQKQVKDQKELGAKLAVTSEKQYQAEKKLHRQTYINTKATNAYEDAIEKLNYQKRTGVISQNQYNSALKKEKIKHKEAELATKQHSKSTENLANQTIRYLRWAGTIAGVIYAANRAWTATLGIGIQVNKMMEDNTAGIASLLSANTQMILSNGQVVNSYEKFKIGQKVAKETMEDLRKASIKTYATFPQLTEIFQQAIGQTLSMGDAFGGSTDTIVKNTVQLSQSLSNIAGAIGMPMDRVREEIRSMLSGNASTDSLISTMLFGSPGEANKAIKDAKARGKDGLTDVLREMLKPFDALSDVDSYTRSLLQLEDAWSQAMAGMSEPVFDDLKDTFKELAQYINDSSDGINEGFTTFYETAKEVLPVVGRIGIGVGAIRVAAMVNPFTAWAVTLASIVGALQDVSEELSTIRHEANIKGIVSSTSGGISTASTPQEAEDAQKAIEKRLLGFSKASETNLLDRNIKTMQALADEWVRLQGIIDGSTRKVEAFSEAATLVTNMGLDSEIAKQALKYTETEATKLGKLKQALQDYKDEIIRIGKEAEKIPGGEPTATQKSVIDSALKVQVDAKKKAIAEIAEIELKQYQKEEKARQDRWVAEQNLMGVEVLKSDMILNSIEAKGQELLIAKEGIQTNQKMTDLYNLTLKYNQEITREKDKQNKIDDKIDTTYYDVMIDSQISMLEVQKELAESTNDWADNLEGVAGKVIGVTKAFSKLRVDELTASEKQAKSEKTFVKNYEKLYKNKKSEAEFEKDSNELTEKYIKSKQEQQFLNVQNQINGYGQISGAMSQMFDEGSKEAASFQAIESGLAVVAGVRAIMTAGTGDPYTAVARMVAMAAMVSQTLSQAGIAFGGGKEITTTYDTFSAQEANIGAGSVLGDKDAQSESIQNSLETLEDLAGPEFELMYQMSASLISIDQKLGGVAAGIIKKGGFAFGEGFTTSSNISGIGAKIEQSKISSFLNTNIMTAGLGEIAASFFGSKKITKSLSDSGLAFGEQLITEAVEALDASAYQTIETITKKKKYFKSKTTIAYQSYFDEIDDETARQFELVLGSLYDTVVMSGDALDIAMTDVEDELSDFYINLGKVSLKDKTGEEIQDELTAIFGKVGDEMVEEAFPALEAFQQIGEGMFETLTRVAVGMEEAEYFISKLGYAFDDVIYTDIINQQGIVSLEALRQSIVEFDEEIYGAGNGVVDIVELVSTSASDLFETYTSLSTIRDQIEFIGTSTDALTSSMLLGADGIDSLSDAMETYFENFLTEEQKVVFQTQTMTEEFAKLNQSLPESKEAFTELLDSIDVTSDSGQELWGRIILLSDGFVELTEVQEDFYDSALEGVLKLSETFENLGDSIDKTIETLLGKQTGADSQDALISSFWTKRSELDILLAKDGDLTTSEQERLSALVGDINTLSTGIQGATTGDTQVITENLVDELSGLKDELDLDNKILNVRIVEFQDAFGVAQTPEEVGVLSALPSYDTGSPYIPYDQMANIHRGEMVIDSDFASKLRRYGMPQASNNVMSGEVLSELKQISAKMGSLEKTSADSFEILNESQYEQRPLSVTVVGTVQTETA